MAINLFSDYGGFYNNYKVTDIPKVDPLEVKRQDELKAKEEEEALYVQVEVLEAPKEINETAKPDLRSKMADLDNISLTFNANDDYSYLGSDFNIENLDMARAISEMKQDKIIQDYNYFVGSDVTTQDYISNDDGKVFLKF